MRTVWWAHLPTPFTVGEVIPSNRHSTECHFTFRCANGETYYNRFCDLPASAAYAEMHDFVAFENGDIDDAERALRRSQRHPFSWR